MTEEPEPSVEKIGTVSDVDGYTEEKVSNLLRDLYYIVTKDNINK